MKYRMMLLVITVWYLLFRLQFGSLGKRIFFWESTLLGRLAEPVEERVLLA